MRRIRGNDEEKKGSPAWMITYSDMVTLLLCFFVLLFAFSEVDAQKFQAIMSSFQGSLGIINGGQTIEDGPPLNINIPSEIISDTDLEEADDFRKIKKIVEEYAEERGLQEEVQAKIEERGLIIRILNNVFFDSGKAIIKSEAEEILLDIGDVLLMEEVNDKHIKIEGHTDSDKLIITSEFKSNWELSALRATRVLEFLLEHKGIEGNRISFSGFAYYRPVAPNDSPENKAKNRRVDIVILRSSYSKWETN